MAVENLIIKIYWALENDLQRLGTFYETVKWAAFSKFQETIGKDRSFN